MNNENVFNHQIKIKEKKNPPKIIKEKKRFGLVDLCLYTTNPAILTHGYVGECTTFFPLM